MTKVDTSFAEMFLYTVGLSPMLNKKHPARLDLLSKRLAGPFQIKTFKKIEDFEAPRHINKIY